MQNNMRSNESPMDFQYDNPVRQVPGSPFTMAGLGKELNFQVDSNPLKRDWPASPSKAPVFSWNTPSANATAAGARTGNVVQTPRHLAQHRGTMTAMEETPQTDDGAAAGGAETASDRDSPIGRHGYGHDLQPKSKRNKLSDLARLKLRKQRERRRLRDALSDDDEDNDRYSTHYRHGKRDSSGQVHDTATGTTAAGGGWSLDAHRDIPYIASGYLQLGFNLFVLGVVLYFAVVFIRTIQADVGKKVEEYSAEILAEISQCSREYLENRCSPDQRVPAMQMACQAWERCMERDPGTVGRARVSAETFAEIVNSFIEPISYKTMAFCALLLFGSLGISNAAFGLVRSNAAARHRQLAAHNSMGDGMHGAQPATFMIQATPHRGSKG